MFLALTITGHCFGPGFIAIDPVGEWRWRREFLRQVVMRLKKIPRDTLLKHEGIMVSLCSVDGDQKYRICLLDLDVFDFLGHVRQRIATASHLLNFLPF